VTSGRGKSSKVEKESSVFKEQSQQIAKGEHHATSHPSVFKSLGRGQVNQFFFTDPLFWQIRYIVIFAEIDEDLFKDEDRSGAADNGQRLSSEKTENSPGDGVTQKRFQNSLKHSIYYKCLLIRCCFLFFLKIFFGCAPFGYLYFRYFHVYVIASITYIHPVYGARVRTHDLLIMSRRP
jgi:hypothetical protein